MPPKGKPCSGQVRRAGAVFGIDSAVKGWGPQGQGQCNEGCGTHGKVNGQNETQWSGHTSPTQSQAREWLQSDEQRVQMGQSQDAAFALPSVHGKKTNLGYLFFCLKGKNKIIGNTAIKTPPKYCNITVHKMIPYRPQGPSVLPQE